MYLPLAIIGYIFIASAIMVDKLLVRKNIPNPFTYTFYLGILNVVVLFLAPLGFYIPSIQANIFAFLCAATFIVGSVLFYSALKFDETSRVAPIIGTLNPVFTLFIGFLFAQTLTQNQLFAVLILIVGLCFLSTSSWWKSKLAREHLLYMVFAALFFALSTIFQREVFLRANFITGLIIVRIYLIFLVSLFLLSPNLRQHIFQSRLTQNYFLNKITYLLIFGQLIGAFGGLLTTYAIFLVNPAIVNALQGVEYVFILGVILISKKYRKFLDEDISRKTLSHKLIGSLIIVIGLIILAFNNR